MTYTISIKYIKLHSIMGSPKWTDCANYVEESGFTVLTYPFAGHDIEARFNIKPLSVTRQHGSDFIDICLNSSDDFIKLSMLFS